MSCTGYVAPFLPEGPEREEALGLIRLGIKFRNQHSGRKRGFLFNYVKRLAAKDGVTSFGALVGELELEAARRNLYGERASPVEKVDRVWGLVTLHLPGKGEVRRTFHTLENIFSKVRTANTPMPGK